MVRTIAGWQTRSWGAVLVVCLWVGLVGIASAQELDQYGGYRDLRAPGGGSGFFRVEKIGSRWVLVTPEGHVFWLRAVYAVHYGDGGASYLRVLKEKHQSPKYTPWGPFVAHAVKRLRSWGFNALGEYSASNALPIGAYGNKGNPERMPFIRMINAAHYAKYSNRKVMPNPVKDVVAGLDRETFKGYRGTFPDVFDPNFPIYYLAAARGTITRSYRAGELAVTPWLIGTTTDDRDHLYGFGADPDAGSRANAHDHLGWIIATTAPSQTSNARFGQTYSDTTVYAKYAFRDFFRQKYVELSRLNAAWGARYTTWESDGSWPTGRGVLDESGRNPWLGRDHLRLSDSHPQVKADLNEWLEAVARKYFSIAREAIKDPGATPHHLIFSSATISAAAREPVLRAAAAYCDVIQYGATPVDSAKMLVRAYNITRKPGFTWVNFQAHRDSPLAGRGGGWGSGYNYPTQEERGQAYLRYITEVLDLRGDDGVAFIVGIDWWEWTDKVIGGEANNFGLVTNRDNAYDGKEARRAQGTDEWGYSMGGEAADYGDFLSSVRHAHSLVHSILRREHQGSRSRQQ